MILVVDIGNSNVVAAFMGSASDVAFSYRFRTKKADEKEGYAARFEEMFKKGGIDKKVVTGGIVSSVVPEITDAVCEAVAQVAHIEPLVFESSFDTGLIIDTESPKTVGLDRVAGAAGAAFEYDGALAVFDLGTTTTLSVVTRDRKYKSGLIMPGIHVSMRAMLKSASLLPKFEIVAPKSFIGGSVVKDMQSGLVYGPAAMLDALSDRTSEELGCEVVSIITGGLGGLIYPYCKRKMFYEPDLVLKGLWYIYERNIPGQ